MFDLRIRHRAALAGATLLLLASAVHGQGTQTHVANASPDNDRRQVIPFLDATYVAFARADDPRTGIPITTFEADIVPNFVVRQTFFDVLGEEETAVTLQRQAVGTRERNRPPRVRPRFAYSVAGVPMVRLRMFVDDRSSPVRTPSYMPKGTGQLFMFWLRERRVDLFAFQGTVGHHSNGQDGCLFEGQDRESEDHDAPCLPEVAADRTPERANRTDGSFSTNYVTLGVRYRRVRLDPVGDPAEIAEARKRLAAAVDADDWAAVLRLSEEARTIAGDSGDAQPQVEAWRTALGAAVHAAAAQPGSRNARQAVIDAGVALIAAASPVVRTSSFDLTTGVDLELNPGNGRFLGGGGIDPELKSRYGATRVTVLGGIAWRMKGCNRAEVKGFGKYIHEPVANVPSWAGSVEGQCLFRQTNWGLFARFYRGQDYYNLGFEDDVRRFQFGVTYSQEGFLRFRAKPVTRQEAERLKQL